MSKITGRYLALKDLDVRVEWFNNNKVYNQMSIMLPITKESTIKWFHSHIGDISRKDFAFDLKMNSQKKTIAMGGLTNIDHRNRNAELYVVVDPNKTGKGYGTSVIQWISIYGFSKLLLNRIYLNTLDINKRARSLYSKMGFKQEGVLRKHVFHNGEFVDRYVHALLKSEWQVLPWKNNY